MSTGVGSSADGVAPGWYADPNGLPSEVYWDGSAWTEQRRPQVNRPAAGPPPAQVYVSAGPQNGAGTAALVCGILGLLVFPIVLSVVAIITGSVGVGRANRGQATNGGAARWGLTLGLIGLIAYGIFLAWYIAYLANHS